MVQFPSVEVIRVARSRKESVSRKVLALEEMNEEERIKSQMKSDCVCILYLQCVCAKLLNTKEEQKILKTLENVRFYIKSSSPFLLSILCIFTVRILFVVDLFIFLFLLKFYFIHQLHLRASPNHCYFCFYYSIQNQFYSNPLLFLGLKQRLLFFSSKYRRRNSNLYFLLYILKIAIIG